MANGGDGFEKKVSEALLQCEVCLDSFDTKTHVPRILPCHHTFCGECVETLQRAGRRTCPKCRKEVPGEGVFPVDTTRMTLLDLKDPTQTEEDDGVFARKQSKATKIPEMTSDAKDEPKQGGNAKMFHLSRFLEFLHVPEPPMQEQRRRQRDQDTEQYRNRYPGKNDDSGAQNNYLFYTNQLESRPDGDLIDNIHNNWWGQYHRLESQQGYIQWLFPIREMGKNRHAQELQLHEAEAIKNDPKALRRLQRSYELMLDFYGMRLKDKDTGEIERADNWRDRFRHLNRSKQHHMRITRILKSLGELGYQHYQFPLVQFLLREALEEGTLQGCLESCFDFWVGTIKNDSERKMLEEFCPK